MAAFAPEVVLHAGSIPITNTVLSTLLVDAVLIGGAYFLKDKIKTIPGMIQNFVEMIISSFYDMTESISGKNAIKIFPWFMTFFLFIIVSNWSGLIPGVGSIGFFEQVTVHTAHGDEIETELIPLFRGPTSDLNVTFGLALVSLVATHVLAIRAVGLPMYLSRYFSFNPIMLFVGLLEIVSEITKVISLSFRLFGNIYAGEVVLLTISSLFALLAPIPFLLLEVIVGLVQALVFGMLTMVFMSVLMTPHHAEKH